MGHRWISAGVAGVAFLSMGINDAEAQQNKHHQGKTQQVFLQMPSTPEGQAAACLFQANRLRPSDLRTCHMLRVTTMTTVPQWWLSGQTAKNFGHKDFQYTLRFSGTMNGKPFANVTKKSPVADDMERLAQSITDAYGVQLTVERDM